MISFELVALGIKTFLFFFVDVVFGQKFKVNAKNYLDMKFLNFSIFQHRTFADIDQGLGARPKKLLYPT